jgi:hypothetical protein
VLALGFLIMIGTALVADGFGAHVPKGYIYTAMIFSVFIECINMVQRRRHKPVHLRNPYGAETGPRATSAARWSRRACLARALQGRSVEPPDLNNKERVGMGHTDHGHAPDAD